MKRDGKIRTMATQRRRRYEYPATYRQLLRLFRSLESNYILIDYSNIKHKLHLTHFSYFSLSF